MRRHRRILSEAALVAVVRDFSQTTSSSSSSTIILNKGQLFTAFEGAPPPPQLEHSASHSLLLSIHTSHSSLAGTSGCVLTAADGSGSTAKLGGITATAADIAAALAAGSFGCRIEVRCSAAHCCPHAAFSRPTYSYPYYHLPLPTVHRSLRTPTLLATDPHPCAHAFAVTRPTWAPWPLRSARPLAAVAGLRVCAWAAAGGCGRAEVAGGGAAATPSVGGVHRARSPPPAACGAAARPPSARRPGASLGSRTRETGAAGSVGRLGAAAGGMGPAGRCPMAPRWCPTRQEPMVGALMCTCTRTSVRGPLWVNKNV